MYRGNDVLNFDAQIRRRPVQRNDPILRFDVLSFNVKRDLFGGSVKAKLTLPIRRGHSLDASAADNNGHASENFILWADNHTGNCAAWRERLAAQGNTSRVKKISTRTMTEHRIRAEDE